VIDKVIRKLSKHPFLKRKVMTVAEERKCSLRDAVLFLLKKV